MKLIIEIDLDSKVGRWISQQCKGCRVMTPSDLVGSILEEVSQAHPNLLDEPNTPGLLLLPELRKRR